MVKDNTLSTPLAVFPHSLDPNCRIDAIACQLSFGNDFHDDLAILCVYRPPDSSAADNLLLQQIISKFLSYNNKFNILIGDFNFPDILWPNTATSNQGQLFLNFTQENFLTQHVFSATRKSSDSILDLIFSTYGTLINDLSVNEDFGSSDHSIIQFSVKIGTSVSNKKMWMRNLKNADWHRFQELLQVSTDDWLRALDTNDIELVWDNFIKSVNKALDTIAPIKEISPRVLRCSSKVRTALRHKRRSFHALTRDPSMPNLIAYERANCICKNAIITDTYLRERRVMETADQRTFWAYVNQRLSTNHKINVIKHESILVNDPRKIASIFNAYFASIYQANPSNIPSPHCENLENQCCPRTPITLTLQNVLDVMNRLPSKNSTDLNGLSYKILKKGGNIIASRLLHLYNMSLNTSKIPSAWKVAIVTPIHKKDSKLSVKNFRPISVTSCCSRILERIVNHEIINFLTCNNILNNTQHGFRHGNSTETLLLNFYDHLTYSPDNKLVTDCVFFDFQKAFDTVPHDLLLYRISSTGINHTILHWISDFLTNRTQKVRVGHSISDSVSVPSGVVQGSVLGPTLFNMFINEIDGELEYCNILKYADDTRIFLTSPKLHHDLNDLHHKIQKDINNFVSWTNYSGMSLNVAESFFVSFGRSDLMRTYVMNGNNIVNKQLFSDLGLMIQSPLSFKPHVDKVVSKAFQKLGVINKVFRNKKSHIIVTLFKSFVRPLLEYSSVIWCPHTKTSIDNIERVQRRMCRMIPSVKSLDYRHQLLSLGLLSLRARRLRYQLIFVYKLINGLLNIKFNDFFEFAQTSNTRGHSQRIRTKFSSNNYRLNFFTVSVITTWNQLSQEDVDAQTLQAFKIKLAAFFSNSDIW